MKRIIATAIYLLPFLWKPDFEYAGEWYQSGEPRSYRLWVWAIAPVLRWCDGE